MKTRRAKNGKTDYIRECKKKSRQKYKFKAGGLIPNVDIIKAHWDKKKGLNRNMAKAGLSTDPNKAVEQPRNVIYETMKEAFDKAGKLPKRKPKKKKKTSDGPKVIDLLEKKAAETEKLKIAYDCGLDWRLFCAQMLDKYKSDFNAMARDYRNYYQETPRQIRKKIVLFVNHKVYFAEYCNSRGLPVDKLQFIPDERVKDYDKYDVAKHRC